MAVPVGAIIAGGAALAGGLRRDKQQKELAREQMAFQERMSNTAYQRAVKDMRLAGINPMLAYMQGGASSPGGAMAQLDDVISPAVSSAQHARRLKKEMELMTEQRKVANKQWHESQQRTIQEYGGYWDPVHNRFVPSLAESRRKEIEARTEGVRADNVLKKLMAEIYTGYYGRSMKYLDQLPLIGGGGRGAIGLLLGKGSLGRGGSGLPARRGPTGRYPSKRFDPIKR